MIEAKFRELVGVRVYDARMRLGMSQDKLAALSGMSQPLISMIEYGKISPRTITMAKLAAALKTTVGDLVPAWGD